jgi:FtsP/CotA-like multicopper oxidase with cupredoxin domain
MVVRKDDRVRIRIGQPVDDQPSDPHPRPYASKITGTDGGWIPPAARWPEVTVDIGVGQMRAIEFVADNPGDWAFHCHKSHHTMNAMGHSGAQP